MAWPQLKLVSLTTFGAIVERNPKTKRKRRHYGMSIFEMSEALHLKIVQNLINSKPRKPMVM